MIWETNELTQTVALVSEAQYCVGGTSVTHFVIQSHHRNVVEFAATTVRIQAIAWNNEEG
jgi:hypothetical protein